MSEVTEMEWQDLTDEQWREYRFPAGAAVRIIMPAKLACKAPPHGTVGGGSHRIVDIAGQSHYIPAGWLHLRWQVKDGKPPFTF